MLGPFVARHRLRTALAEPVPGAFVAVSLAASPRTGTYCPAAPIGNGRIPGVPEHRQWADQLYALYAASREARVRRLGRALAQTSGPLNTLEQRLAPRLEGQIAAMSRTLDEPEREEHARLKRLVRARVAKRAGIPGHA